MAAAAAVGHAVAVHHRPLQRRASRSSPRYLVEGGNFANEGLGAIGKRAAALNEGDALWAAIFAMAISAPSSLVLLSLLQRLVHGLARLATNSADLNRYVH